MRLTRYLGFWVAMLAIPALARTQEIPIWPGAAPGSEEWTQREVDYTTSSANASMPLEHRWKMVRDVVAPTVTIFRAPRSKANGMGIIICPGGGFRFLSWESEGTAVAQWLAARGVTAFVLKYRLIATPEDPTAFEEAITAWFAKILPPTNVAIGERSSRPQDDEKARILPLAIADGRQAVKFVRHEAVRWGLSPSRIGIMGFSAGAAVTMGVVMDHDAGSEPNFAAPIYGGETEGRAIPADAPPLFIVAAEDDQLGDQRKSETIYSEWLGASHSAELHIFAKGGHGFGMMKQGLPVDHWIDLFGYWLDSH